MALIFGIMNEKMGGDAGMKNRKQLALLLAAVLTAYTCRMIPKFAVGEWALQLSEPLSLLRSVIYLTLFMGWGCSLKKRIRQRWARRYMVGAAGLMVFWLFVRTLKFFFAAEPVEYRYLWYLYYVPMLFLPCTALSVALTIGERDDWAAPRQSRWLWVLSGALLALVLSNDAHQLMFRFPDGEGFFQWSDHDYAYGPLFRLASLWQVGISLGAFGLLLKKCRLPGKRGYLWLPAIPLGCAMVYLALYGFGFSWFFLFFGDLTVVQCLLGAATLESCIQCGLIHSNARYGSLFEAVHGCSAQITDRDFAVRYRASDATSFTEQQMRAAVRGPLRLPDGRVLHTMPVSGGYALWTEDNRELLALTEELEELREELKDRGRLLRQEYGLERGRRKVEEQNRLYDLLQSVTQKQIDGIAALEKAYRQTPDKASQEARNILAQIAVLCCFIKRRKHLALCNYRDHRISAPELRGAFRESMQTLKLLGVAHSFYMEEGVTPEGAEAGTMYDFFEGVMEGALPELQAVNVRISRVHGLFRLAITAETPRDLSFLSQDFPGAEFDCDEGEWSCLLILGREEDHEIL